jgi:5-methylcytosine-specific restriction endonuclease McrA
LKIRITRLDKLFSQVIRARDKKCQRCGTTNGLQCAHTFSRRNKSVRWDPENAQALCYGCHLFWAHSEPILFTAWIKKRLGPKRFKALQRRAMTPKIWTPIELAALEEQLKAQLK